MMASKCKLLLVLFAFIVMVKSVPISEDFLRRQPALVVPVHDNERDSGSGSANLMTAAISAGIPADELLESAPATNYAQQQHPTPQEVVMVVRDKQNKAEGPPSSTVDNNYETPNYDFKYQVHGGGNFYGHAESRRDEKTEGQYHVLLPDGRRQIVSYYADQSGYHPTITYEIVPPEAIAALNNPVAASVNNLNVIPQQYGGALGAEGQRAKRQFRHGKKVNVTVKRIKVAKRTPQPQFYQEQY